MPNIGRILSKNLIEILAMIFGELFQLYWILVLAKRGNQDENWIMLKMNK